MNGRQPDRLTRLEANVDGIAQAVAAQGKQIGALSDTVGTLVTRQASQGKWSTQSIVAFLGGLFTLFIGLGGLVVTACTSLAVGIWTLGIVPMQAASERNAGDTRLVWENTEKRLAELREGLKPLAQLPSLLREIETQFDGAAKMRQEQWDTINRLVVPLWKRTYDVDVPMPSYHPEPDTPSEPITIGDGWKP